MCGIAGAIHLRGRPIRNVSKSMEAMNKLLEHRGPDGEGTWIHANGHVAFTHRRLSIIDLSEAGAQPMHGRDGSVITYNGEIYNYLELRRQFSKFDFRTNTDTEVILAAHEHLGGDFLDDLYGMFSFALWDEKTGQAVCARDRFGIKPFYYTVVDEVLYFASEIKALLPFLTSITTDPEALTEYLTFQFCLEGKTLFAGIRELLPAHRLIVRNGRVHEERYWQVEHTPDQDLQDGEVDQAISDLMQDSVAKHMRADVPVGVFLSGGLDSSVVACMMKGKQAAPLLGFHGKFSIDPACDESAYARSAADHAGASLRELDIDADSWFDALEKVIYHMDQPAAGPGAVGQYLVSQMAAKERKVALCGIGGDEIFGGYVRFLVAYFEQCIKGAIEGTGDSGRFVVTYESILPNLTALAPYKPMLRDFWREGLFGPLDERYFHLIDRSRGIDKEVRWDALGTVSPMATFKRIFNADNVPHEAYFDLMTHFDFKTLLPALLQVEDRVSMAHGLESRVPFLDHRIVELAAAVPADIKFKGGELKRLIRTALGGHLPSDVLDRPDKMGFPVPFAQWIRGERRPWVRDILGSERALQREFVDNQAVLDSMDDESRFSRRVWGFLCLELWHRAFHDREDEFKRMLD